MRFQRFYYVVVVNVKLSTINYNLKHVNKRHILILKNKITAY